MYHSSLVGQLKRGVRKGGRVISWRYEEMSLELAPEKNELKIEFLKYWKKSRTGEVLESVKAHRYK